jgi:hypothetical protein
MKIHYNEFKIGNLNNKWTLSELVLALLTKWSTWAIRMYIVQMWIFKFSFINNIYIELKKYYNKKNQIHMWTIYMYTIFLINNFKYINLIISKMYIFKF